MKIENWSPVGLTWHRFRYCQAWCAWAPNGIWIKSYTTVVAFIEYHNTVHIRPGYEHYSRTTSKQRSQIISSHLRGTLKMDCHL